MKKRRLFSAAFTFLLAGLVTTTVGAQSRWEKYRDDACKAFLEKSQKVNDEFKLGSYERWDFDQDTGKLIFSDRGVPKVIASIEFAGSWSKISETWLWAWNNQSIVPAMKTKIRKVRDFGKSRKFSELTTSKWPSDPEYAWTITAVAGHILGAKTAYRAPDDDGNSFLLIFDLKWAKQ